MNRTAGEFQEALDAGKQHIVFLGPSGVGKTAWQRRLVSMPNSRFTGIEIDARIARNPRMAAFLNDQPGQDEAERMGNAFGTPWTDPSRYREKEDAYLAAEKEEMAKLRAEMEQTGRAPIAADLTGSAIYCRTQLEGVLSAGLGVYLEAGRPQYDAMRANFLRDPKPVCWGEVLDDWDKAVRENGSRANENLPELYARLLETRAKLYKLYADVTLPWSDHRGTDDPRVFLEKIKIQLNAKS